MMNLPNTKFLKEKICYSGHELRPHWVSEHTHTFGDGIVAFLGAADVLTDALVDLEDKNAQTFIKAKEMLHFIVENFHNNLSLAIYEQRLMIALFQEVLGRHVAPEVATKLLRRGDDLFVAEKKLSVSIVTISSVSCLCHFAVNVDPEGAPVAAIGLNQLQGVKGEGIALDALVQEFFELWCLELQSIRKARCKVLPRV